MSSDLTASACRQRADEMRALAEKTLEPAFRRSCEELAEGWEALAQRQDAPGGLEIERMELSPRPAAAIDPVADGAVLPCSLRESVQGN